jgi:hypothetical protein
MTKLCPRGQDVFINTDYAIKAAIRKIQTVLRGDAEKSQFIQTISSLPNCRAPKSTFLGRGRSASLVV